MTQKQTLIIIICAVVIGFILFGLGYLIGISFEKEKSALQVASQLEQLEKITKTIEGLSFNKITSISVSGKVKNISGRTITVTNANESIDIPIKNDAQIFGFRAPAGEKFASQKIIEFKEIKKGDILDIRVQVLQNGDLEGVMVTILPLVTAPQNP